MKNEIWKDIVGYEGKYQVSNLGNVKSLNYHRSGREQILKPRTDGCGYQQIVLYKSGNHKTYGIHRLVAIAFLENSENLPEVNHKDEDKTNNAVTNLEWCDRKQNCNYGSRNKRSGESLTNHPKTSKKVLQFRLDGTLIKIWPSVMEVQRQTGWCQGGISMCCRGECKTAYGYIWQYASR